MTFRPPPAYITQQQRAVHKSVADKVYRAVLDLKTEDLFSRTDPEAHDSDEIHQIVELAFKNTVVKISIDTSRRKD